jgi:hypothetical protein
MRSGKYTWLGCSFNRDGKYTVWFRTPRGQGTGIVHLADGKLTGGDCFFIYEGTYEVDDKSFTATLTTRRCAAGPTTVFGLDEIELKLAGTFKGATAFCSGTSDQAPGLCFEATLFGGLDQPPPDTRPAAVVFDAARFAKIPGGQRPRKPFAQR